MSETLAFLIDAPLQSWGVSSKFQRRESESWPTKSGVIGLLAAALGIDKNSTGEADRLAPFQRLIFTALRWPREHPSLRLSDFHTIGGGYDRTTPFGKLSIPNKAGDGSPFGTVITRRTYLMDARFIILLQGDRATLEEAAAALHDPVWGIWFGRKSCIPASPLGPVVAVDARAAVASLLSLRGLDSTEGLSLEGMTEAPGEDSSHQMDQPTAYGRHNAPVPEAYLTRSIRHLKQGELP